MNGLIWNVLIAFVWMAMQGEFSSANFIVGFALGFVILLFTKRAVGVSNYILKLRQVLGLALFFIYELIKANIRVALDVLTPGFRMHPAFVAIPLEVQTDAEITLLANLISLTPGTISLDVSTDKSTLYIHAMYVDDPEDVRREIKNGFEKRVLQVMR